MNKTRSQSKLLYIVLAYLVFGGGLTFYASNYLAEWSAWVVGFVAFAMAAGSLKAYRSFVSETDPIEKALSRATAGVKKFSDDELAVALSKETLLAGAWRAYQQTLFKHPNSGRSEARTAASEHFNVGSILKPHVDLPVYQATANWLIGIGIFFTFVGLTGALAAAGASFQAADVASMKGGLERLLSAASAKFITSLTGIFCSVLFSIGERRHYHELEWLIQSLCDALDERYPAFQFEEFLVETLKPAGADDTARKMSEAVEALSAAAAGLKSVTAIDIGREVGATMSPIFSEIRTELSALRAIKADQGQEMLRNLIQELRDDVIVPIANRLDQNARLTQEVSLAVQRLHQDLGEISSRLAGASESILHFQQDTMRQLNDFAANLQGILGQFSTDTQGVLQSVAREINQVVAQGIRGLGEQRDAFQQSATQAADTFRGIRSELETALQLQAQREALRAAAMEQRLKDLLTQFGDNFERQTATLHAVGEQAASLMQHARQEVSEGLKDVVQMLQTSRAHTADELDRFRVNYQQALDTFFRQQNNLLEATLGQQREGLSSVIQEFRQAFAEEAVQRRSVNAEFAQSMNALDGTLKALTEFSSAVGIHKTERMLALQQLAGQFGDQVDRLDASYRDLSKAIGNAMTLSNDQLQRYMQAAEAKHQQFFEEYDTAIAKISDGIMQAADFLVEAERERRESLNAGA